VAALGMGIGAGYYLVAVACTLLILLILAILPYLERYIDEFNQSKVYVVKITYQEKSLDEIEYLMKQLGIRYRLVGIVKSGQFVEFEWEIQAHKKRHDQLALQLMTNQEIIEFKN
jgi:putative Mg2+ transporter-C (MgtC) family protein